MTDAQFERLMEELRGHRTLLEVLAGSVIGAQEEPACEHPIERRVQTAARWQAWTCQDCGHRYGLAES